MDGGPEGGMVNTLRMKCALLLFLLLTTAAGSAERTVRYARVELRGALADARPAVFVLGSPRPALHEFMACLDGARRDEATDGVLVKVSGTGGWAQVQEIRGALQRIRRDGKPVVCMLQSAGNRAYYLATAADHIYMLPTGTLMLTGLRGEVLFARDMLDRIGVRADFVQVGQYKGAAEPLTRSRASAPLRESLEALLQDYFDQLVTGIVDGRELPISRVNVLIRRGPFTAKEALEAGLIDGVMFPDEVGAELSSRHRASVQMQDACPPPTAPGRGPDAGALFRMLMGVGPSGEGRRAGGPTIAVIHAMGPIVSAEPTSLLLGEPMTSAERLVRTIRRAADDEDVRAIVLRVDSPGGSMTASDLIWRQLRLADRKKPVVASLGETAASGGYYLACGARRIYAEPGTLTGSIGVFGGKLALGGLFEKLGLHVEAIERGGGSSLASVSEPLSEHDRQRLEHILNDAYETFLDRVAETRPGMAAHEVERVAQGRVWTGAQALLRGLVDELGGLKAAVDGAREAAGIGPEESVRVEHLPKPRNVLEELLLGSGQGAALPLSGLGLQALPDAEVRRYVAGLLALRDEWALCMMPAAVSVR